MSVVRELSTKSAPDWRPLVLRTSGSATEGVYGLIGLLIVLLKVLIH
jgi:hypothetical protein